MQIKKEWLIEKKACNEGVEWFYNQKETDGIRIVKKLIVAKKLEWANWLIVRIMDYNQYVSYAIFAAEQVIDIYERRYPNDDRPRKAIESAKNCLQSPNKINMAAANAANAAANAAYAAANTAYAAMKNRILKYGLKLLVSIHAPVRGATPVSGARR